jgi:colicin import membrane protein
MKGFTIIMATILSTIIHFFVLVLLDTIPLLPTEVASQPNIYMVDLVTLTTEQPALQEEAAVQQKVEEVKKAEVKQAVVKKEEVKKEEVKKAEPQQETVKKEEVKKTPPKDDEVVLSDQGTQQEKKQKTEDQTPDLEKQRLAAVERVRQNVPDRGTDGATTADYDFAKLEKKVKGFWAIPDALSAEGLKAVIVIEIDKKGEVVRTEFEQSSGNDIFDQAALRAIKKAAPFDPPRGSIPLKVGLRFP